VSTKHYIENYRMGN